MPKTARTEAIDTTSCPTCGADFGEPCRGVERRDGSRRRRKSLHAERWEVVRVNEWVTAAGLDEEDDDLEAVRQARNRHAREVTATSREPLRSSYVPAVR